MLISFALPKPSCFMRETAVKRISFFLEIFPFAIFFLEPIHRSLGRNSVAFWATFTPTNCIFQAYFQVQNRILFEEIEENRNVTNLFPDPFEK